MKTSLKSASFPVAIGTVDRRLIHRTLTRSYYGLRKLVHASPLRKMSIQMLRRLRKWMSRRTPDSA